MLLGTLGAILLGIILAGKGVNRAGYGSTDLQPNDLQFLKGKGIIRAGYGSKLYF